MAVSQNQQTETSQTQNQTHAGVPVTVVDTETHRGDTMLYVEYEAGEYEGNRRWVFADEVQQ